MSRFLPFVLVLAVAVSFGQSPAPGEPTQPATPPVQVQGTGGQTAGGTTQQNEEPTPEQVGDALVMHQRYQAAIAAYQKAPQNSPDVLNKLGIAYQMMFDTKDALRCYKASLKLDPKNARVLNNLGTVYDSLKQYGQAEKAYRRAIKLDPKFALAYKNLGSDLMAQHNYRKGSEAYRQALVLDPYIFSGKSSLLVENPAKAQDRGAINYYMARGCARAGQVECAVRYLRASINEGFATPKKIAAEADFAPLRGQPEFKQLMAVPAQ
ncbi:MAG: tetratricopeptide repeat protein [Terracidiphilus sp.]|nr:tetratricopeptide repeat protein [Terracidiphilus sp.]